MRAHAADPVMSCTVPACLHLIAFDCIVCVRCSGVWFAGVWFAGVWFATVWFALVWLCYSCLTFMTWRWSDSFVPFDVDAAVKYRVLNDAGKSNQTRACLMSVPCARRGRQPRTRMHPCLSLVQGNSALPSTRLSVFRRVTAWPTYRPTAFDACA